MNTYKLVVFDWEGTIVDTLGLVLHTILSEAKALGLGDVDIYETRKYVDLGLVQALKKVFPDLSEQKQEQLLQAVNYSLVTRPSDIRLIPGIKEFVEQLHAAGIYTAVATNKGQYSLMRSLQSTGLDALFKVTRSAGQVPAKPDPQMLEEIMAEFACDAASTLMIGDSPTDMEMAAKLHVAAIGMDFYHQQESSLKAAGALAVFDDYELLAQFLHVPHV